MKKMMLLRWRERAKRLKTNVYALYLAYKDPRVPWYARLFIAGIVAYALNPLDLIPDFIPVLGYLDDFILLPLGIILALKMIPPSVLIECQARAELELMERPPRSWLVAGIIVLIWLLSGFWLVYSLRQLIS